MGPRPRLSLKARALQWLAQREHSRLELRRKLLDRARRDAAAAGEEPDAEAVQAQVDALLDALQAAGHLSEERFVEARLRSRAPRQGNLRIRNELARHGLRLPPDEAAALQASEFERARAVWQRKFDAPAADAAGRARQARFLAGRGFSAEVILRLLRSGEA